MLCNCAKRFVFQTKTDVRAFIIAQRDFQGRGIDRRIPANASEKKKNYVALCSPDFHNERKNKAWFTLAVKRTVKSRSIKNLRFFSSIRTKRSYTITFSPSLLQFFFFFFGNIWFLRFWFFLIFFPYFDPKFHFVKCVTISFATEIMDWHHVAISYKFNHVLHVRFRLSIVVLIVSKSTSHGQQIFIWLDRIIHSECSHRITCERFWPALDLTRSDRTVIASVNHALLDYLSSKNRQSSESFYLWIKIFIHR